MSHFRFDLIDMYEEEGRKTVATQLALMEALPLTERESILIDLGIRAGIGAVRFTAEGEHG